MSALMQRVRTLGAHEVGHTLGEARRVRVIEVPIAVTVYSVNRCWLVITRD